MRFYLSILFCLLKIIKFLIIHATKLGIFFEIQLVIIVFFVSNMGIYC